MTVRLRAHHVLCLLTYAGRGYSAAFVANMDRIAVRLNAGEPVEIVAGPDDICAPLRGTADDHCERASVHSRDAAATAALALIPAFGAPGLDEDRLGLLREAFRAKRIRQACTGCPWDPLCTDVAERNFAGVRVVSHAGPSVPCE